MHNFVEAIKFIGRDGQIPGTPHFPTLVHLTLETLKVAGIGIALALLTGYSGTLGDIINDEASYHLPGVLGAAICIAALALLVELALALVQRAITPRGLKRAARDEPAVALAPLAATDTA